MICFTLTDLTFIPQCQWAYRAFEDVEELQRERGAGEKEESPFRPYPVENGFDHGEENGTNGTSKVLRLTQRSAIIIIIIIEGVAACLFLL